MEFVENKGQWDAQVKFKGDFTSGSFFLRQKGFSVLLHNAEEWDRIASAMHGRNHSKTAID